MFLNEYVKNIYIINLDSQKERMKNISDNFNDIGIEFQRISAIKPKKIKIIIISYL